jgi:hypothetical protein
VKEILVLLNILGNQVREVNHFTWFTGKATTEMLVNLKTIRLKCVHFSLGLKILHGAHYNRFPHLSFCTDEASWETLNKCLGSFTHSNIFSMGPKIRILLLSDSCGFVDVGASSLTRSTQRLYNQTSLGERQGWSVCWQACSGHQELTSNIILSCARYGNATVITGFRIW